jgi:hypothetical protein
LNAFEDVESLEQTEASTITRKFEYKHGLHRGGLGKIKKLLQGRNIVVHHEACKPGGQLGNRTDDQRLSQADSSSEDQSGIQSDSTQCSPTCSSEGSSPASLSNGLHYPLDKNQPRIQQDIQPSSQLGFSLGTYTGYIFICNFFKLAWIKYIVSGKVS